MLAGGVLSLLFLGLFALGFYLLYGQAALVPPSIRPGVPPAVVVAGMVITVLGLYAIHFLSSFLALFLAVGAIAAEVDSGTLHAVLARPIRRAELVLGRWLGGVVLITAYTVAMAALELTIAWLIAGYQAPRPFAAIGLMVLGAILLLTLSLLGSAVLSTLANGVVTFTLFALAWLAGIIEWIGATIPNQAMINLGVAVSLLIPSDAIWRAASYYVETPAILAALGAAGNRAGIPFWSVEPPTTALIVWAAVYPLACLVAAIVAFNRRDL